MALRVSPLLSQSMLMVLAFLHVSGLTLGPGQGPAPGPFLRSKRANSFLLEEILQGNLERECREEVCNYEEAREVFEDHHRTATFWASYYDGDQCESAPCGNGGNCTDLVGGFYCTCPAPFYGETCELGLEFRPKAASDPEFNDVLDLAPQHRDPAVCQTSGPSSCEQLCTASEFSFSCSCLTGFRLRSDRKHCEPEVEFPCGQIPDQLPLNSSLSLFTNHTFPWQVSVLDWRGVQICWGALIGHNLVLTSAHCLQSQLGADLDPNQIFIRLSGQPRALQVRFIDVHERFSLDRHDYDLALLHTPHRLHLGPPLFHLCVPAHRDHAEIVLMHAGKQLLVEGCGSTARSVTLEDCRKNVSHGLSNKMFCLETKPGLNQDRERKPGQNKDQRTKPQTGQDQKWTINQTTVRTTNKTMDHSQDLTRAIGSNNNQSNEETDSLKAQNGLRQGLNTSQSRPVRDKEKVLSHLDQQRQNQAQPRLNQTQPGPFQDQSKLTGLRSIQDQQRVDLLWLPTGPDQDHPKHSGKKQDQSDVPRAQPPVPWLFHGAPAVSVDHETAYLVGLLTSAAPAGGSGAQVMVFTKLSRHMTWLQRRLGHMTPPQVIPRP